MKKIPLKDFYLIVKKKKNKIEIKQTAYDNEIYLCIIT